jgi:hypothetical protein
MTIVATRTTLDGLSFNSATALEQRPAVLHDLSSRSIPTSIARRDPILFALDQELGEGAALWVAPELADPVGSLEVGEHQNVEQLGAAGGWTARARGQ